MKSVEEIEQIRKQKREELDLRVNLNSATKSKKAFILKQGKTMKDFELSFNI